MFFFRIILFFGVIGGATVVIGQVYQNTIPSYQLQTPSYQSQTSSYQSQTLSQPNSQLHSTQQPLFQMPLQTPPKTVIQNGVPVYQQHGNSPTQPVIPNRTMPTGYGSPYPTGQYSNNPPVKVATTQQLSGSGYGSPLPNQGSPPQNQPTNLSQHKQPQRELVGHAEPLTRIVPFFLTPQEQQELDEFLIRWEKYSLGIKRYDVDFNMFLYNETYNSIPGKPYKTAFGYFKYIAKPLRFVYHVEGEWIDNKKVERDEKKNRSILTEKIIIDEKSVFKYEFDAKKVLQVNVPPELVGKGIADSPLPLIFGAKAEEMKKRFSMKIVTGEQYKNAQIWLLAKPLLLEDQQEFSQIEIRLDKDSLRAIALKKEDINGKAFTVYTLLSPKINDRVTSFLEDIKKWFTPVVPDGWTLDVNDWVLEVQMAQQPTTTVLPTTPPTRNEIPLYQPR
jgi:TIGR03009 family protein